MIYFTADLHAFHKKILEYDNLEHICGDLESYQKLIIKTWNDRITDEDTVYLLGDTAVGGRNGDIFNFLKNLKGIKYLIKGNHEKEIMKCAYLRDYFEWIKDYFVLDYDKYRFVLMHYPIEEWLNKGYNSIHLHGHSHGNSAKRKNRLDVGFSAMNFYIPSIEDIIEIVPNHNKKYP